MAAQEASAEITQFEWPTQADLDSFLQEAQSSSSSPAGEDFNLRVSEIYFQKPYCVYGMHWTLSNGTTSPFFNSHEITQSDLIRKSPPVHQARNLEAKRLTKVSIALKTTEANTVSAKEHIMMPGVQIYDDKTAWPAIEFVRGDPIGTWDSTEIPSDCTLVGFHGEMTRYESDATKADLFKFDCTVSVSRLGLILLKKVEQED